MRRPGPPPLGTQDQGGRLPTGEVAAGLRLRRNPNIDAATVSTLASCEWIKKGQPLCLIGDSGTGKSHMLIALGTEAAVQGYRVRYTLATKLVNELVEAADEKQLTKTIARYGRVDLLCIDELGYMELDRHSAELLFQVLTEREEKNSVAIASNESFGGWTKTFTDPRLCAAIVDRLTFNGTIIETGTDSYRLATTRARTEQVQAGRRDPAAEAVACCRLSFSKTRSRRSSYSSRSLRHSVTGGRGITMPSVTISSGLNCSRVRSISMPMPRRFHQW